MYTHFEEFEDVDYRQVVSVRELGEGVGVREGN
jgi:hypothetical protein